MSVTTPVTADQLLRMPDDGHRYELVAGNLRKMTLASWEHGAVASRLHGWLAIHIERNDLGMIFSAETGFLLSRDPDTVRAPDIGFLQKAHIPDPLPEQAFWPGPPDLVVEVVSPGDTMGEVDDKVKSWLDAGASLVWVVNPKSRTVTVHRSATEIGILTAGDELRAEDLLPGFHCRVGEMFVTG